MGKHTPTPWKLNDNGITISKVTIPDVYLEIATIDCRALEIDKANAELIVKAVNSHEELINFTKDMVNAFDEAKGNYDSKWGAIITRGVKAIAKAEE